MKDKTIQNIIDIYGYYNKKLEVQPAIQELQKLEYVKPELFSDQLNKKRLIWENQYNLITGSKQKTKKFLAAHNKRIKQERQYLNLELKNALPILSIDSTLNINISLFDYIIYYKDNEIHYSNWLKSIYTYQKEAFKLYIDLRYKSNK